MQKIESARTLVLNASYEPLLTVEAKHAFVQVLTGKAETVLDSEIPMRSQHLQLFAPSVIRLTEYVVVPDRSSIALTRRTVTARDRYRCAYQTPEICTGKGETIDHVIPKAQGGRHIWENVVAACRPCNQRKADRTPEEARMPLMWPARRPLGANAKVLLFAIEEAWEPFLFS